VVREPGAARGTPAPLCAALGAALCAAWAGLPVCARAPIAGRWRLHRQAHALAGQAQVPEAAVAQPEATRGQHSVVFDGVA